MNADQNKLKLTRLGITGRLVYVSLHDGNPRDTGEQASHEVSYPGYARQAIGRDGSGWKVLFGDDGIRVTNKARLDFGINEGPLLRLTHLGIGTAPFGPGRLIISVPLTSVAIFSIGMHFMISAHMIDMEVMSNSFR